MLYDFLIVGAGPFGAVCARELSDLGYKVLVIDRRDHIGGNCYTQNIKGVHVHVYGPHIFHTNNKQVWDWVNRFAEFNKYRHQVVANYEGEIIPLPFNMFTFNKLWGVVKPSDAKNKIKDQSVNVSYVKNLEDHAIKTVGLDVYNKLIKGYTQKQWGRDPVELPPSIINRLPVRYTFDNDYFNDRYQGIPIGGYTQMFEKILEGIDVKLNVDFLSDKDTYEKQSRRIIYTGPIDKFFNYKHGKLEYRSLRFETENLEIENYQGCAQMNFTDVSTPYTRIVEHKHFDNQNQKTTVISKEYSVEYNGSNQPYYPINDDKNNSMYNLYKKDVDHLKNYIFGGRLATYKYYDMHQVIASALKTVSDIQNNNFL
jgi:UDP-galactopyranose mutase